jgi:hypothetical protein
MPTANNIANLRRRVNRARNFPTNTCASSRALVTWAEDILKAGSFAPLEGDAEHVAECMLAVVESLWKERTKLGSATDAECAALAKAFMLKRQGPVGDADSRDRWHEQLGLVTDAYVELLSGDLLVKP